jgi:MoxR-like ATPase
MEPDVVIRGSDQVTIEWATSIPATGYIEYGKTSKLGKKSITRDLQNLVSKVAVSQYIVQYASRLTRATRPKDPTAPPFIQDLVDWGAGPRAGQFLIQGGKALAAMDGRFSVAIEDVQKISVPVLRHRISTNFQAQAEGMTNEDIIERLVRETPPPVIPKYE